MKKLFTLLLSLLTTIGTLSARPVDPQTAASVAQNFYTYIQPTAAIGSVHLTIAYQSQGKPMTDFNATNTYFYVFNDANGKGYVIVSGDDRAMPVLAYSTESNFDPSVLEHQTNTVKWFEMYKAEIRDLIENNASDAVAPARDWEKWKRADNGKALGTRGVAALVTTRWNQDPYENALCPYDYSANERTVTGCVATAMAQIMKFWNYPTRGTGYSSYQHQRYGTLSANYGNTTYGWSSMPNYLSGANAAVATLMYHCGVSVKMNYNVGSAGGSGAYHEDLEKAYENYFGYSTTVRRVVRSAYSLSDWTNLLKTEINARRPVHYGGSGNGGGHSFVCDGYDDNGYFHFNWGWGGNSDGYFFVTALNPPALGTGGGAGGFNSGQDAIIGIQPATGGGGGGGGGGSTTTPTVNLYSAITVNPDPISYGSSFTVKFNLINKGTTNFVGSMTAALFDENDDFVDTLGQFNTTGTGLPPNYIFNNGGLTFNKSNLDAPPGLYTICAFVKSTGGEWTLVGDGNYENCIEIEILDDNSDGLELYAPITTTPSVITLNQSFISKFDIANFGTTSFSGKYSIDLHELDGTHVKVLKEWTTSAPLQPNNHYTSGLNSGSLTLTNITPGTYLLGVWAQRTGGDWELIEQGSYKNPTRIVVASPPLQGDIYEPNNTAATSYTFIPSYNSANSAKVVTNSANVHLASDNDYFKIALPAGYKYTFKTRVHDQGDNGDGQIYTSDVLFSYSTGGAYSEPYDVYPANDFTVQGASGKNITFWVAPYFAGLTGTYKLDILITRAAANAVEDVTEKLGLKVAPNPVNDQLQVYLDNSVTEIQNIEIFDVIGRQKWVSTPSNLTSLPILIPTTDFAEGMYILKITTMKGFAKQKFVVKH
jgi:hypothetical protein